MPASSVAIQDRWATNPRTPDGAIKWAQMQVDSGAAIWNRRCQAFVERAYGVPASGISYAVDMWNFVVPADMKHASRANIPKGALLVYSTGSRAGHIALYAGDGIVYSNDIKGAGKIARVSFDDLVGGIWNLNYLGWVPPYFKGSPVSKINSGPPPSGDNGGNVGGGEDDQAPADDQDSSLGNLGAVADWASDSQNWLHLFMIIAGAVCIIIALARISGAQVDAKQLINIAATKGK